MVNPLLHSTNRFCEELQHPYLSFRLDNWSNAYIDYYGDSQCLLLTEGDVPYLESEVACQATESSVVTNPLNPTGTVYSQLFITTSSTPVQVNDAGGTVFE